MRCNICGAASTGPLNGDGGFPACAACGSQVRQRAIALLLSRALFGCDIPLSGFPQLKSVRGLGISDVPFLARPLERIFSYTNTFYHQEPSLDLTAPPPPDLGLFDFIVCSEILEHVPAPVGRAFDTLARLLKPSGFLLLTVPYSIEEDTIEHFKDVRALSITTVDGKSIAVGKCGDGSYRVFDDLVFHSGDGSTLEMRVFCETGVFTHLRSAGFERVDVLRDAAPHYGIAFNGPCSLPILAGKSEGLFPRSALAELVQSCATQKATLRAAAASKWLRLGRALGLGPKLD